MRSSRAGPALHGFTFHYRAGLCQQRTDIVLPENVWYPLSAGRLGVKVGFTGQEILGGTSGIIMVMPDNVEYKTTIEDEHWRNEEFQWARILSEGHPAKGMVLLYIQKACTAFHEFEPAWKAGAVKQDQVEFFRRRLATRIRHVLVTMENNGLDKIKGATEWGGILHSVESAKTAGELAELTERVHAVNHVLLDSLEGDKP